VVIMQQMLCMIGWHNWGYAIMPGQVAVTRACRRCHKFDIYLAEPASDQLQRIADIEAVQHLFTRSGRPR
jgi:hypothetical protein